MSKYKQLFEFVYELVTVQIDKYVKLASRGVGPDARLNATLVLNEVTELISIAESLLKSEELGATDDDFYEAFNQVKFYLGMETLRAYAGFLLDPNNIHSGVDKRLKIQLSQLKEMAQSAGIEYDTPSEPSTEIQLQCEYDSYKIAFFIIKIAKDIKENPDMEMDKAIPEHAQSILRKNAKTRYVEYAEEIDKMYSHTKDYLDTVEPQNSREQLTKEVTLRHSIAHKSKCRELLEQYREIAPRSRLFAEDYKGFEVASSPDEKPSNTTQSSKNSIFSTRNILFVGSVVGMGLILVSKLLPYFYQAQEELYSTGPQP